MFERLFLALLAPVSAASAVSCAWAIGIHGPPALVAVFAAVYASGLLLAVAPFSGMHALSALLVSSNCDSRRETSWAVRSIVAFSSPVCASVGGWDRNRRGLWVFAA